MRARKHSTGIMQNMLEAMPGPPPAGPGMITSNGCDFRSSLSEGVMGRMSIEKVFKAQALDLATAKSELVDADPIGMYFLQVAKSTYRDKVTGVIVTENTLVSPDFNNESIGVWTDAGEHNTGSKVEYQAILSRARTFASTEGHATLFWVSPSKEKRGDGLPEHRAYLWKKNEAGEVTAYSYQLSGSHEVLTNTLLYLSDGASVIDAQSLLWKSGDRDFSHTNIFDAYESALAAKEKEQARTLLDRFRQDAVASDSIRRERVEKNRREFEEKLRVTYIADIQSAIEAVVSGFLALASTDLGLSSHFQLNRQVTAVHIVYPRDVPLLAPVKREDDSSENLTNKTQEDTGKKEDGEADFGVYFVGAYIHLISLLNSDTQESEESDQPMNKKAGERKQAERYIEELRSASVTLILPFLAETIFPSSESVLDISKPSMVIETPQHVVTRSDEVSPIFNFNIESGINDQEFAIKDATDQELPVGLLELFLASFTPDREMSFSLLEGFETLTLESWSEVDQSESREIPAGQEIQDGHTDFVQEDFMEQFASLLHNIFAEEKTGKESGRDADESQEAGFWEDRKMVEEVRKILGELGTKNRANLADKKISRLNLLVKMYESEKIDPDLKQILATLIYFEGRQFLPLQEVKLNDAKYSRHLQNLLSYIGLEIELEFAPIEKLEILAHFVLLYFLELLSMEKLPTFLQFTTNKTRQFLSRCKKLKKKAVLYQYNPADMIFNFPPLEKPESFVTQ